MPDLVKDVEKVKDTIDTFENIGRRYMLISIASLILGLAIISAIVFYIIKAVSKGHIVVSDANLFTSKLEINVWLLGFICIGLYIITSAIKYGINNDAPQFKPENLAAVIDKSNSVTDFINSAINKQTVLQKGGSKIERLDKKTNKNEKECICH